MRHRNITHFANNRPYFLSEVQSQMCNTQACPIPHQPIPPLGLILYPNDTTEHTESTVPGKYSFERSHHIDLRFVCNTEEPDILKICVMCWFFEIPMMWIYTQLLKFWNIFKSSNQKHCENYWFPQKQNIKGHVTVNLQSIMYLVAIYDYQYALQ